MHDVELSEKYERRPEAPTATSPSVDATKASQSREEREDSARKERTELHGFRGSVHGNLRRACRSRVSNYVTFEFGISEITIRLAFRPHKFSLSLHVSETELVRILRSLCMSEITLSLSAKCWGSRGGKKGGEVQRGSHTRDP